MKRTLQICLLGVALCGASRAAEQISAGALPPLPPVPPSPVQTFRILLATNETGRGQWLALRNPEQRQYLESKIKEYESIPAAAREERLQTLQLRWYLPLLMKMKSADRARQLARIPQPDRALLEGKLRTWDILPPQLRNDILENEKAISVFLPGAQSGANDSVLRAMSPERREELQRQFEHLNELPKVRREQILAHFQKFFELKPDEKSQALRQLTPADRQQMQQTLATFDGLPKEQRDQAVAGFKKFADLSPADRAAFLKTAAQWQTMNEADRERWRQIVTRLQKAHIMPPPPMPSSARRTPALSLVTTNY